MALYTKNTNAQTRNKKYRTYIQEIFTKVGKSNIVGLNGVSWVEINLTFYFAIESTYGIWLNI